MTVVADASPLIALAQIGRLGLLSELFADVAIPPAVYAEIAWSVDLPAAQPAWLRQHVNFDRRPLPVLRAQLDVGESEAVALALELKALLLIDERRGRRVAQARGLSTIGTLGVLVLAKRHSLVEQVAPLIQPLRAVGFWLGDAVVREALRAAGELDDKV